MGDELRDRAPAPMPHFFEIRKFVWSRGVLIVIVFEFHGSEVAVQSEELLAVSVLGCLEATLELACFFC